MTTRWLLIIAALGILARLALAAVSSGSYDALLWHDFAEQIWREGLLDVYRTQPSFNHPPIPGLWASLALRIASATSMRFEFLFKLSMIAADAATCFLIWKILGRKAKPTLAAFATASYAWNLDAILISAYHCNTDSIYAMLALLAVYLIEERGAHLLAGLALGAAINVKLIPVILIVPMIASCRNRRSLMRFLIGLAVAAIPFIPVLSAQFVRHAIAYNPPPTYWGIGYFLMQAARNPDTSGWAQPILNHFNELGRYVIVLTVVLISLLARRRIENRYNTCAATAALTLILAPGFAIQYTVFPLPLMAIASPWLALIYGTLAGVGALVGYWLSSSGGWPLSSTLGGPVGPAPGSVIGLLAWAALVVFVCITLLPKLRRHVAGLLPLSGSAARS